MDTEFLVQIRQSNKCANVKNDEIFNLHFQSVRALESARHQPHLLIRSAQAISQKKAKNPHMRFNSQEIVSYCFGLRTQNRGLREVDLEPNPKRDRLATQLREVVTRSTG